MIYHLLLGYPIFKIHTPLWKNLEFQLNSVKNGLIVQINIVLLNRF